MRKKLYRGTLRSGTPKFAVDIACQLIKDYGIKPVIDALYKSILQYEREERQDDESVCTQRQAEALERKLEHVMEYLSYHGKG